MEVQPIRPRTDDRPLWDVIFGVSAYPAMFAAHRVGLFRFLAGKPRSLGEICEGLEIKRRPAEAMLAACVSGGMLERRDGHFELTPLAEDYLLESSPTYFGHFWDLIIDNYEVYSYTAIEKAIRTDSPQVLGGEEIFQSLEEQAALAKAFTRGMHSASMAPALAWPDLVDLSRSQVLLDVGGGSGAHSIGAVMRWPELHAIVFDIADVCEVADEFIAQRGLQDRIDTWSGDMWGDPFPAADTHFYSNIFHDWPPEKGRFLSEKSFESLQSGGSIVLHEVLYNDDKTGPFAAAGFSISMLGWSTGEQYSAQELAKTLTDAGFRNVDAKPTFGYYSVVTAHKP